MAAILNFRIFPKNCKTKNAYISENVLDRAISTKFLTHRVSLKSNHPKFQKILLRPKYIHSIKIWKSLDFGIDWLRNGQVIND